MTSIYTCFQLIRLRKFLIYNNFELIDVFPQPTHGGSMRYIISRKNEHSISGQRVTKGLIRRKQK